MLGVNVFMLRGWGPAHVLQGGGVGNVLGSTGVCSVSVGCGVGGCGGGASTQVAHRGGGGVNMPWRQVCMQCICGVRVPPGGREGGGGAVASYSV